MKSLDLTLAIIVRSEPQVPAHGWSISALADVLQLSTSVIHQSVCRLQRIHLLNREPQWSIYTKGLLEVVHYVVPYVFPAELGAVRRGIATAQSLPIYHNEFVKSGDLQPVWPHPHGQHRGAELAPLHKAIPEAIFSQRLSPTVHDLFGLIDLMRIGASRERRFAQEQLRAMLGHA